MRTALNLKTDKELIEKAPKAFQESVQKFYGRVTTDYIRPFKTARRRLPGAILYTHYAEQKQLVPGTAAFNNSIPDFAFWCRHTLALPKGKVKVAVRGASAYLADMLRAAPPPTSVPDTAPEHFSSKTPWGPRTQEHYNVVLCRDSFIPPNDLARAEFDTLFKEVSTYLFKIYNAVKSWDTYLAAETDLRIFLNYCAEHNIWNSAKGIGEPQYLGFVAWLKRNGAMPNSMSRYCCTVLKFLRKHSNDYRKLLELNAPKRDPPNPDPMPLKEAEALLTSLDHPKDDIDRRDKAFSYAINRMGLRIGEAIQITPDSFYECNGVVCIRIEKTKNGIPLHAPVPLDALKALCELIEANRAIGMFNEVFLSMKGKPHPATARVMREAFKKRAAAIGITRKRWLRPHNQRSRFIYDCVAKKMAYELIAHLVNHIGTAAIRNYHRRSVESLVEVLQETHPSYLKNSPDV